MWHIMTKLPAKVDHSLNGYWDVIEHIKGQIWVSDSLDEFEESSREIVEEFILTDNEWLR